MHISVRGRWESSRDLQLTCKNSGVLCILDKQREERAQLDLDKFAAMRTPAVHTLDGTLAIAAI